MKKLRVDPSGIHDGRIVRPVQWQIDRAAREPKLPLPERGHNADNLSQCFVRPPPGTVGKGHAPTADESLANRVLSRPEPARERVADHRDRRGALATVFLIQKPAAEQSHP